MKMFKGFKWTANPHLAEPPPSPEAPTAHDMHAM